MKCPVCGLEIDAPAHLGGSVIACPRCNEQIRVPYATIPTVVAPPPQFGPPPPTPSDYQRGYQQARGAAAFQGQQSCLGCILVLILSGVAMVGFFACCGGLGVWGIAEGAKEQKRLNARPKASAELQQQRKALIDKYGAAGMYVRIETPGSIPHVFVNPVSWSLTDIQDKEAFANVFAAYHYGLAKEAQGDTQDLVIFFDSTTGSQIAVYAPDGFGFR